MRILAVLLVLLNLAGLAWTQGWVGERPVPSPAPVGPPPFQQAGERLVLLDELPLDQLALMEQIAYSRSRISDAQGRISDVQQEITDVQQQLRDSEAPETLPPQPWCASAGAFADEGAASAYVERVEALGGRAAVTVRQEPVSSTWWVHIPPLASEVEARALLDELQAKRIDSYYMRSGELAGGISLGVFSREESARTAQRQLQERGYTTSIREIFRLGTRTYVDITMPDAAIVTSPEWAAFLAAEAALQVTEKACGDIAPQNQFP